MALKNNFFFKFTTVLFFYYFVESSEISFCDRVHVFKSLSRVSDYSVVYNFSLDISLTALDEFNTIVSITNFTSWSINSDIYFQDQPIQFETDLTTTNISCSSIGSDCNVTIFNAINGNFYLPLNDSDLLYTERATFLNEFNIDNGVIFDHIYGNYFNTESMRCYPFLFPDKNKVCCTHFKNVDIPNENPGKCVQFSGNTTFTNSNGTILSSVFTHYAYTSIGIEYTVTPNILSSENRLSLYPNEVINALFLIDTPTTYFDYDSEIPTDLYITMGILLTDTSLENLGETISGRIIERNEILLKDLKTRYTPEDPCYESMPPDYGGSKAQNKFCCTKFQIPSPEKICSEYNSITKLVTSGYYKGTYFNVKYQFNDTTLTLTIQNYESKINSTLQIEAYSTDLFSQTCQVTTTAPQKICNFKTSATNKYDLKFRTSYIRDGMNMISISLSSNQIIYPSLTPTAPCKAVYDFTSNKAYDSLTEFCCILKPNGPWPGSLEK